jgi:hypothetical protein
MRIALLICNQNSSVWFKLNKRRPSLKNFLLIFTIMFLILGCGEDKGFIRICLIDAPPPQDVEHIYLAVMTVGIRNAEGDPTTLVGYPYSYDIARLIGGRYTSLTYSPRYGEYVEIDAGDYTRVLLLLSQINYTVRDGTYDTLLIPDGTPVIYELEQDFTVLPDQIITIVVDFDASKSINWESQPYELTPSFKTFPLSVAGFLRGIVKDTSGNIIKFAVCMAANAQDTFTTMSDSTSSDTTNPFSFQFTIPEGIYNISVSAEGYTTADTTYTDVNVIRDSLLNGYNFTLE